MIILDTNVVSEVMKPRPAEEVISFLDSHAEHVFYLTSITVAELWAGVEAKRDPVQRADLAERAEAMFALFAGRIIDFDGDAAKKFGSIVGETKRRGEKIHFPDGAIAAIAQTQSCSVATRDVRPFEQAGLEVINPWESVA